MNSDWFNKLFIDEAKRALDARHSFYDAFWDAIQQNGALNWYNFMFYGPAWNDIAYNPKYTIDGRGSNHMASTYCYSAITDTKVAIDVRNNGNLNQTFSSAQHMKTIRKLIVDETTVFSSAFNNAVALENIVIEGTIGNNGFDIHWSTKLTHDSIMSIITALQDKTGVSGTWTVTLGSANLSKLSDAEICIAESKGWVLA